MNEYIKESFEKTRVAGSIAANALDEVSNVIKPGISTDEIDKIQNEDKELQEKINNVKESLEKNDAG